MTFEQRPTEVKERAYRGERKSHRCVQKNFFPGSRNRCRSPLEQAREPAGLWKNEERH